MLGNYCYRYGSILPLSAADHTPPVIVNAEACKPTTVGCALGNKGIQQCADKAELRKVLLTAINVKLNDTVAWSASLWG